MLCTRLKIRLIWSHRIHIEYRAIFIRFLLNKLIINCIKPTIANMNFTCIKFIFLLAFYGFFPRFQAFSDPLSFQSFMCVIFMLLFGETPRAKGGNSHFALFFSNVFSLTTSFVQKNLSNRMKFYIILASGQGNTRRLVAFLLKWSERMRKEISRK